MAKTWKDRLTKEYNKLGDKIDKLEEYVNSDFSGFNELQEPDRNLLITQLTAMVTYHNILEMRMKRHGLIECECEEVKLPDYKMGNFLDLVDGIIEAGKSKKQKEDEEDGRNS